MAIVDINGNPINVGQLEQPQTASVSALAREWENHPAAGMTPQRLAALMRGAETGDITQQLDLADDMEERDGHLFAELDKRKGAVAALDWAIEEPKNADAAEKKLAAQLTEWVESIEDFEDLVRGMMDAVHKGFAQHEMVWSLQNGVHLPRITFRPQRWFTVDRETRNVLMLRKEGTTEGEALRPFNWITHVHKSRNGYLARGGLVRVLAWPYLFKNFATADLAEFLAIYGLPLRVGKYPSGAGDAEKAKLLQAVVQIGHNAAGIIPQGMAIEFMAAASGTDAPFNSMADRMEAIESKVILGQTLSASEGNKGSHALGKVHNEVRMDIRNSDAGQVAATLTRQLLWPMLARNVGGADPRRLPALRFDTSEAEDLAQYAEALPKLAQAGATIPVKWVHDKLRIPLPEGNEPVLKGAPEPAPPGEPGKPGVKPGEKLPPKKGAPAALAADITPGPRDALDDLADAAAGEWRNTLGPMVGPLVTEMRKAVATGESLEAFMARLPELLAHMDITAAAEQLARVTFMARLTGEADLEL